MSIKSLINADVTHLTRCMPDDFLDEAIAKMVNANRNAIAVMDGADHLCGILTDHDIIRAVHDLQNKARAIEHEHVSNWMTNRVITCDVKTKLSTALQLMGRNKIRHLILTENALPVAIASIRDILAKIHEDDELEANVLRDIAVAARAHQAA